MNDKQSRENVQEEQGGEIAAWMDWKVACSIDNCLPSSAQILFNMSSAFFRADIHRKYPDFKDELPAGNIKMNQQYAWRSFERYAIETIYGDRDQKKSGKSYKDGMFLKAASTAEHAGREVIPGDFWGQYRMMFRSMLNRELEIKKARAIRKKTISNESGEPYSQKEEGPEAWWQWENDNVASRVNELLPEFLATLEKRERIYILVCCLGIPVSHPVVCKAMGVGKSIACATGRRLGSRTRGFVVTRHPVQESEEVILDLARRLICECHIPIIEWARSEISCRHIFLLVESRTPLPQA